MTTKGVSQDAIVNYFKTRVESVLIFDQSALSQKLKNRGAREARVHDHPNALSSKHPSIVTCPDVEKALFLWFKQMEEKGKTVSGPMLVAKCERFKVAFDVPAMERHPCDGWVGSFCNAYKIKERRRHGEAGSVDIAAVAAEQACVATILSSFALKDQFNFDETSFFLLSIPIPTPPAANHSAAESLLTSPQHNMNACMIVQEFTMTAMGLPQAEQKLQSFLGSHYKDGDWRPALKAVMDAENNTTEALKVLDQLTK